MLIKSMLRKNPEHRSSASELLKHAFLQPYVSQYRPSHIPATPTSPTKPICTANGSRKNMAESESSNSSCSDRDSIMSSEMQEHGTPVVGGKATDTASPNAGKSVCRILRLGDGLQETDSPPAKSHYVSKQPRVIKNIIMALKEGKSRENTSPLRDYYHATSSGASNQRSSVEASPKVAKSGRVSSGFKANSETPPAASDNCIKRIHGANSSKRQSPVTETPPKTKARHEVSPPALVELVSEEEFSRGQEKPPALSRTMSFPARMRHRGCDREEAMDDMETGQGDVQDLEQEKPVPNSSLPHFPKEIKYYAASSNRMQKDSRNDTSSSASVQRFDLGNDGRTPSSSASSPSGIGNCSKQHHEIYCKTSNQHAIEVDINESRPSCSTPSSSHSERLESSSKACDEDQVMDASPSLHMEVPSPSSDEGEGGLSSSHSSMPNIVTQSNMGSPPCKEILTDSSSFTICPISSDCAQPNTAVGKETLDVKSFRQRADALEELLELSADLLQQNRLEELGVVLKPFGKEKVSPRDTVIWLAKSIKGMMLEESGRRA